MGYNDCNIPAEPIVAHNTGASICLPTVLLLKVKDGFVVRCPSCSWIAQSYDSLSFDDVDCAFNVHVILSCVRKGR
jgi:hypothetical protein